MNSGAIRRLAGAAFGGVLAFAGAAALSSPGHAEAINILENFRYDAMSTGTCAGTVCGTSFGTIAVTGDTTTTLTYTVTLSGPHTAPGVSLHGAKSGGEVFFFDLSLTTPGTITFSGLTVPPSGSNYAFSGPNFGSFVANPGNFPGPYDYEVICTTQNPGDPGNLCGTSLTFTASGASAADPFVIGTPLGHGPFAPYTVPFVADLSVAAGTALCPGTDACTGLVGAPEPSTWTMMLIAFAGLGFAGYRASRRTAPAA